MTRKQAIKEALLLGGFPSLMGILVILPTIPLTGKLTVINIAGIIICLGIGLFGGLFVYKSNMKLVK